MHRLSINYKKMIRIFGDINNLLYLCSVNFYKNNLLIYGKDI